MITAQIFRNEENEIYGFTIDDHADSIVCSAVSALVINAINSIETFTDEHFICEYEEEGGLIKFELPAVKLNKSNKEVNLLLNSLLLGLSGIKSENDKDICILDG